MGTMSKLHGLVWLKCFPVYPYFHMKILRVTQMKWGAALETNPAWQPSRLFACRSAQLLYTTWYQDCMICCAEHACVQQIAAGIGEPGLYVAVLSVGR